MKHDRPLRRDSSTCFVLFFLSRVRSAVLTVLLVEPPQLDLVGLVLGLLLQPAGSGTRGEDSVVSLRNK